MVSGRVRVYISDWKIMDGVRIAIVTGSEEDGDRRLLRFTEDGSVQSAPIENFGVIELATMSFNNDIGRDLLDALLRHYQGASDMHTVRADLIHERARVDKMLDIFLGNSRQLADIAEKLADS